MAVAYPAIEARKLYRFYHIGDEETLALRGVSLVVNPGEMVAVVGASGSGKSTLIARLAGLDEPDGGFVYVNGERLTRRDEAARTLIRSRSSGLLLQSGNLFDHLTVRQNVAPTSARSANHQFQPDCGGPAWTDLDRAVVRDPVDRRRQRAGARIGFDRAAARFRGASGPGGQSQTARRVFVDRGPHRSCRRHGSWNRYGIWHRPDARDDVNRRLRSAASVARRLIALSIRPRGGGLPIHRDRSARSAQRHPAREDRGLADDMRSTVCYGRKGDGQGGQEGPLFGNEPMSAPGAR